MSVWPMFIHAFRSPADDIDLITTLREWSHTVQPFLMFDFLHLGKYHLRTQEVANKRRYKPLATLLPFLEGYSRDNHIATLLIYSIVCTFTNCS